ncbi:MAG: exosortase A [Nitrosospira sp.]
MSVRAPRELVHDSGRIAGQSGLRTAAVLASITVAAILFAYHATTWAMVSIWERSDTFAHGFLIFPFSAYLIWTQREKLRTIPPQPNPLALLVLAVLGFGWLLAALASVQVLEQYLFVAMIPAVVWAILGSRMVLALAFPLAYLLLAVPFGEALIPPLIEFTADFTVKALQLSGIPVYREGSFFAIPSGNWSVVEACSGLRYLIASFTLGMLYAYLTYRSLARRLVFIALSVIVPIIANGIRAYLIVMTGHLSDMQLAVGVDHLIYGWIFFGFVMLLLFWCGSLWREDEDINGRDKPSSMHHGLPIQESPGAVKGAFMASAAVIAIASFWPAYGSYLEPRFSRSTDPEITISGISEKWQASETPESGWTPVYVGEPAQLGRAYRNGRFSVDLYISYYRNQRQGKELISSGNVLVPELDPIWRNVGERARPVDFGSGEITINESQLRSSSKNLVVWRWYWLGDEETISPYMAKMLMARKKLLGRNDDAAEIIVASSYDESPDEAILVLQDFLRDMMPEIMRSLKNAEDR